MHLCKCVEHHCQRKAALVNNMCIFFLKEASLWKYRNRFSAMFIINNINLIWSVSFDVYSTYYSVLCWFFFNCHWSTCFMLICTRNIFLFIFLVPVDMPLLVWLGEALWYSIKMPLCVPFVDHVVQMPINFLPNLVNLDVLFLSPTQNTAKIQQLACHIILRKSDKSDSWKFMWFC